MNRPKANQEVLDKILGQLYKLRDHDDQAHSLDLSERFILETLIGGARTLWKEMGKRQTYEQGGD